MIRKMVLSTFVLALVIGVAAVAVAEKGDTKKASGKVESVMMDSLKLSHDGQEWAFVITDETKVVAKGGRTLTKSAEAEGKKTTIMDFVKKGQQVTVEYNEKDGKLYATKVTFPQVR